MKGDDGDGGGTDDAGRDSAWLHLALLLYGSDTKLLKSNSITASCWQNPHLTVSYLYLYGYMVRGIVFFKYFLCITVVIHKGL